MKERYHFLDSGAFTLRSQSKVFARETGRSEWDFYNTKEFWAFMERYAQFVKKYWRRITLYANMDVIQSPELTWRNQQYLEKEYGLSPVPVIHAGTDLTWVRFYLDRGYQIIALGGLVGRIMNRFCREWLDNVFDIVCSGPERLPCVRVHGFGVGAFWAMRRYPWWSVDSQSWGALGNYGVVYCPYRRRGDYVYNRTPWSAAVCQKKKAPQHISQLPSHFQKEMRDWVESLGYPMGKARYPDGEVIEEGVATSPILRRAVNIELFARFCKAVPPWPWPFPPLRKRGFGLL